MIMVMINKYFSITDKDESNMQLTCTLASVKSSLRPRDSLINTSG